MYRELLRMLLRDAGYVQRITECYQEMQDMYRDLLRMKPRDVEYVQRITECYQEM